MITKEKNAALNLNIPENLKKEFVNFTYNIGTNPTNLLKMFMIHTIRTKKVAFDFGVEKVKSPVLDLEFEPLDTSNWSPASIKKAERITKRLEEIL